MTKLIQFGDTTAICLMGGKMFTIQVDGKRYEFEDHHYCGPTLLNRKGDPLKHQPTPFLKAASLWSQQGRKVEDGLCVWYRKPEPILKHMGGRHYLCLGEKPAVKGE